ncbi:MAG TPA: amylo-alpha-1,6-glucosidase [Chloroflexia bacterium]|nr:amylo-alpha-1,6-glucosidase [Chloroflexia bacterium]
MITLDRTVCRNLGVALTHEWLVTNGLGGYAAGTLPGMNTRRYHGLLIAALNAPVERTQLVAKCDEEIEMDGVTYFLGANEYPDNRVHPGGFVHLDSFRLEHGLPCFVYRVGPAYLEKTIWMEYGRSTTYVRYKVRQSPYPMTLILRPFVNYRDHHELTKGNLDWNFGVTELPIGGGCTIKAQPTATPFYLIATPRAAFTPSGVWYWNFVYRAERERGLPYREDLYLPGVFRSNLAAGESLTMIATAEPPSQVDRNVEASFNRARARQERLLRRAGVASGAETNDAADPTLEDGGQAFFGQLVKAADQFLVQRAPGSAAEPGTTAVAAADPAPVIYSRVPNAPPARNNRPGTRPLVPPPPPDPESRDRDDAGPRTIIAGYPWFTDWGRDTMIALPGLTLATGRLQAAESILRTFARYIDQGMVPNLFPDTGTAPEYNTVDATLWYLHAIDAYLAARGSRDLLRDLWPQLVDIIAWHVRGTRFGIGMDPADGLLRAGEPGVQLTWMDAKVDDTVFTPRHGKPVEIQALWYHALRIMARWQTELGPVPGATPQATTAEPAAAPLDYAALADTARASFAARFWNAEGGYLYDVVEGPDGTDDPSLRPNQLFALSLEPDLVTEEQAHAVLTAVRRDLLTPVGLRTLAPTDPRFVGVYTGSREERDAGYHQGTVWTWLIGAYGDACRRWESLDAAGTRTLLEPLQRQLAEDCAGSLNEIFDGAAPFLPKGCFAQAWSVAEVLRLLRTG